MATAGTRSKAAPNARSRSVPAARSGALAPAEATEPASKVPRPQSTCRKPLHTSSLELGAGQLCAGSLACAAQLAPKPPPGFGANGRLSQRRAEGGQGTDATTHLALKLVRHSVGGLVAAQCPSTPFEGFSGQVFIAQLFRLDHGLIRRPKIRGNKTMSSCFPFCLFRRALLSIPVTGMSRSSDVKGLAASKSDLFARNAVPAADRSYQSGHRY